MTETTHNRTEVVKVRVNETELRWLRDMAAAEDRTVSSILRLALREFYDRYTAEPIVVTPDPSLYEYGDRAPRRKRRIRGTT